MASDGIHLRGSAMTTAPGKSPTLLRFEVWPLPEAELEPLFDVLRRAAREHLNARGLTGDGDEIDLSDRTGRMQ